MYKLLIVSLFLALSLSPIVSAKQDIKKHHFLKLFDTNNDGHVSEAEFKVTMQDRYKAMDSDQNDRISIEEFKKYSKQRHKKWQQKKRDKLDSDKNGLISKQEFVDYALKRANKKFNKMDKNQDGQLSQEENIKKHRDKKHHLMKTGYALNASSY
jgi:hypothetical protein